MQDDVRSSMLTLELPLGLGFTAANVVSNRLNPTCSSANRDRAGGADPVTMSDSD